MSDIIPYQEIKLENQTVNEIVEDISILKKIEEASKFEIGRRLVYLKETCKHGEYLPKLEEIGLTRATASIYVNFYCRFGQLSNVVGTQHLGYQKIRELLRIPKGKEEEYLNKIPDPNEVTAKQLREEINKLKQEKEQEKLAKEALINSNLELQKQLEIEKNNIKTIEVEKEVVPDNYSSMKRELRTLEREKDELIKKYDDLNSKLSATEYANRTEKEIRDYNKKLKEQKEELMEEDEFFERVGQILAKLQSINNSLEICLEKEFRAKLHENNTAIIESLHHLITMYNYGAKKVESMLPAQKNYSKNENEIIVEDVNYEER